MIERNVRHYSNENVSDQTKAKYIVEQLLSENCSFILINDKDGIMITLTKTDDPQLVFVRAENHAYYRMEESPYRECGNSTDDYD